MSYEYNMKIKGNFISHSVLIVMNVLSWNICLHKKRKTSKQRTAPSAVACIIDE